jgi:threonine dehydratase
MQDKQDYLERILTSASMTSQWKPRWKPPTTSAAVPATPLLKREDLQPVFSFKLRGAYNKMAKLTPDQLAKA